MHEKKRKGDIGVAKAIARLTELGWNVGIPITEHAPYDIFAEKEGDIETVQVRYTTPKKNKLDVKLQTSWADKSGNHIKKRILSDYTVLAVYNPEFDEIYFIRSKDFVNDSCLTLRLVDTMNGQIKGVRMARDYLEL